MPPAAPAYQLAPDHLVWRGRGDRRTVAVGHRPRFADWTLPKAGAEAGVPLEGKASNWPTVSGSYAVPTSSAATMALRNEAIETLIEVQAGRTRPWSAT